MYPGEEFNIDWVVSFLLGCGAAWVCLKMLKGETEVLFFPDEKKPCRSFYNQLIGAGPQDCNNKNCQYAHNEPGEITSLMEIILTLQKANKSIDLCVYEFTHNQLTKILISAKNRGIRVRVITDAHSNRRRRDGQYPRMAEPGDIGAVSAISSSDHLDQIAHLQRAGIPIKINRVTGAGIPPKMHNKFVLVDDKRLIMGSFNWTYSAVNLNDEAVIRTTEMRVVAKFVEKFGEMWAESRVRPRS